MNHAIRLMVRCPSAVLTLNDCISFRLVKERYTPFTELRGKWYCPANTSFGETTMLMLYIDNVTRHYGFPVDIKTIRKDGRTVLDVVSRSYSSVLSQNQCQEGMLTDINLTSLIAKAPTMPQITYEPNTPTVSYVNYCEGTSVWDAIVSYAIRATGVYPYLQGYNTVRVSRPTSPKNISTETSKLISRSYGTDYTSLITRITMKDIDGTASAYVASNGVTSSRMIARYKEINFDHEWVMDPSVGMRFKLDYSNRRMLADTFVYPGYDAPDLLDSFSLSDTGYSGEIDRIVVSATPKTGFVTEISCYHDSFCT